MGLTWNTRAPPTTIRPGNTGREHRRVSRAGYNIAPGAPPPGTRLLVGYDARVMARWIRLAILGSLLLAASRLAAEDGALADDLARARVQVADSAREYRAALEQLLALQEVSARRASDALAKRRGLYEQGFVSRRELEESERAAVSAQAQVDDTRGRLAQTESVLAETLAAIEWARAAPNATGAVATPMVIGSPGGVDLSAAAVDDLDRFFLSRFARALPVSARGQTPVHDRLGLDHRRALDVAVHPDSPEGRAIIEYLERQHIAFLAFRGVIPGASTGAHVHVGRASARVVPASGLPVEPGVRSR